MNAILAATLVFVAAAARAQDFDGREQKPKPAFGAAIPAAPAPAPESELDGRAWVTVEAADARARTRILEAGVSIEQVEPGQVGGIATAKELARLRAQGFKVLSSMPLDRKFTELAFPQEDSAFHDYSELQADLKAAAAKAPKLASLYSIGSTLRGRPILALRLNSSVQGDGPSDKPGIIFLGTHHAREHLSTEIPLMLAQYLIENRDRKDIQSLLATRDIFIVPMVNPDGVEHDIRDDRYHMHRKNTRDNGDGTVGVDLNRNYSWGWGGEGSSGDTDSEIYRGPSAFSEPETRAVKGLVDRHASNVKVLLSYHTFSELILYPWGGSEEEIDDSRALGAYKSMAAAMGEMTGYRPQKSSELYVASGDTTDWAWGTHKIFSFTFEMTPKSMWNGGFYPGAKAIQPTFQANLRPALYLIKLAEDPYRAGSPADAASASTSPSAGGR